MKLLKFTEAPGRRVALVADKTRLPATKGTWNAAGSMDIDAKDGPRIGAGSADIIAGVERDGFFVWPQDA